MSNRPVILRVMKAVALAFLALVISYLSTNMNISLTGEKAVLKYWNAFTDWITAGRDKAPADDVVFINVAHDKQLVDITDDFGIPIGNATITDRQKLSRILDLINESRDYQYVMLDVFFESGYETEVDSALFGRIASMDRLVIPKHIDGALESECLEKKAGYADYATSINENDFTKFLLFRKGGASMPLKAYTEVTGRGVKKVLLWYADNGKLARRVIFPKMYVRIDSPYRPDGQKAYLNLSADILDTEEEVDWSDFFRGKYIVIGSFAGDDIHTTYAGDLPGSLINYNVYLSLMKGQHKIPFALVIVYFLIFFAMAFLLLSGGANASQSWTWVWAKLFVLYSLILTIVCIFVFMIWGQAHDIFITSTFFSIVDLVNRRIKAKKESHA
jgi:CHASE2 domain.